MIKGERINLITLNDEALNKSFDWINNSEISRGLGSKQVVTRSEHEKWFDRVKLDVVNRVLAIQDNETSEIIGIIGNRETDLSNKICSVFIYLGNEKFRGKGLAKEAVELFVSFLFSNNIRKIQAWIYEYNVSSKKMFESLGFIQEAKFIKHWNRDGKYHNIYVYFKMSDDYE